MVSRPHQDYPNASNSLGMSSSPIIIGDVLVVQIENDAESFSAGIHTGTGKNLGKSLAPRRPTGPRPWSTKIPTAEELAILQSSKGATAVDPQTGKTWDYAEGASTIPSGAIQGDTLYLVSNGITAVKPKENQATPETLWQANRIRPGTASPIALGDYLYAANNAGVVTRANLHNGNAPGNCDSMGRSVLRLFNPVLTCISSTNQEPCKWSTNALKGAIAGEMNLEETILSTPSIGHSALYLDPTRSLQDRKILSVLDSFSIESLKGDSLNEGYRRTYDPIIDNYDSFTYNYSNTREMDVEMDIRRNDQVSLDELKALSPERILIFPARAHREKRASPTVIKTLLASFLSLVFVSAINASPTPTA